MVLQEVQEEGDDGGVDEVGKHRADDRQAVVRPHRGSREPANRQYDIRYIRFLAPAPNFGVMVLLLWIERADHVIVMGLEGEHIAQGRVVLRILAIGMRVQQKRQTVVVKREEGRDARQVVRAKMTQGHRQFGYLQFLVVKRLLSHDLQGHRHLFRRSTVDMTFVTFGSTIVSRSMSVSGLVVMWRLSHHSDSHHRCISKENEAFHICVVFLFLRQFWRKGTTFF